MKQDSLRQKSSRPSLGIHADLKDRCFESLSVTHPIVQRNLAPLNSRVLSLKSTRTITIITIVTCSQGESKVRTEYTPSHTAQILPDLLHISRCTSPSTLNSIQSTAFPQLCRSQNPSSGRQRRRKSLLQNRYAVAMYPAQNILIMISYILI